MNQEKIKTSIGGQALIEGLLMVGPSKRAMAVRLPNQEIKLDYLTSPKPSFWTKLPLIRGSVNLFRQMVLGTKALMLAAEYQETEEEAQKKSSFSEKYPNFYLYLSAIIGILFSVGLFMLLPNLITDLLRRFVISDQSSLALTLIEGLVRLTLFILYLAAISRVKDINRVWKYHGAEHKTIACYEAQLDLTVENVQKQSRFHPRCGTSFLFLVMMISILVLALVGWRGSLYNLGLRIVLLPLIAGISYEIIKFAGRFDNLLTRIVSKPGLALQRLTTAEPEAEIIEVAIVAMKAVLPENQEDDSW